MNQKKITLKGIWGVLKNSFIGFSDHKVTKLSGSLAYYTVFSMAPLLVVIISLCGIFLGQEAAQGQVYAQLDGFLGKDTALQLQDLVKKAAIGNKDKIAFIIGIITLLIGATTVFSDIQESINTIWGLKPKPTQASTTSYLMTCARSRVTMRTNYRDRRKIDGKILRRSECPQQVRAHGKNNPMQNKKSTKKCRLNSSEVTQLFIAV